MEMWKKVIKRTIAKLSNKARIKKLFQILNGQNEKFLHFFGISTPTDKDVDEQILGEKYRNFMQDIEKNGLIDYFLQNMNVFSHQFFKNSGLYFMPFYKITAYFFTV